MTVTTIITTTVAPAAADLAEPAALRDALSRIDCLGWDSEPGDAVLTYAREQVVKKAVHLAQLTGSRLDEAVSLGWVTAWQVLNRPDLREQPSPWGVVAAAVRREIAGYQVGVAHRTNARRAWRLARLYRASTDPDGTAPAAPPTSVLGADAEWLDGLAPRTAAWPVSFHLLTDVGWEPAEPPARAADLGPRLTQVVAALVEVGWPWTDAVSSVAWIADAAASQAEDDGRLLGWRELARYTGMPSWQTRRLTTMLLGYRGTVGLIAAMVSDGNQILRSPDVQRRLRSTVHRWAPSPCADAAPDVGARATRVAA